MGTIGPATGNFIYYASQIGCIMDCDPVTGLTPAGGSPTDNTAAINALLATATHTNPVHLMIDGGMACKGVVLATNVNATLEGKGRDAGIFILSGSNNPIISNAPVVVPGSGVRSGTKFTNQAATGKNLILRNLYLNGNRGTTYPATNSSVSGDLGNNIYGVVLYQVSGILVENCVFVNVPDFIVYMYGCSDFVFKNCNFTSAWLFGDGIHCGGNCSNGKIDGNTFSTEDDAVALNAPEAQYVVATGGPISDICISNNVFINSFGVRMYSSTTGSSRVSRIQCVNNSGIMLGQSWSTSRAYLLGNGNAYPDGVDSFSAANSNYSVDATGNYIHINDDCGNVTLTQETWDSPLGATPFLLISAAVAISYLTLDNCTIYRSTRGSSAAYGVQSSVSGASIGRLRINGFNVVNQTGQSYSAIAYLIDMLNLSIGELVIDSLDCSLITALVNPTTGFTGITKISGAGVLATGLQIPDSVMANNTPYISATSPNAGLPCVKIGGTVHPYVLA